MEIAELSAAEKSAVQEHSESLARPETPEAAFREFASRVIGARKAEHKEERPRPEGKPFDLGSAKLDSPEYREWAETGRVTPKAELKKESSESQSESDARATAKEAKESAIDVRAEVSPRIREVSEKAWRQPLQGAEHAEFLAHANTTAGPIMLGSQWALQAIFR